MEMTDVSCAVDDHDAFINNNNNNNLAQPKLNTSLLMPKGEENVHILCYKVDLPNIINDNNNNQIFDAKTIQYGIRIHQNVGSERITLLRFEQRICRMRNFGLYCIENIDETLRRIADSADILDIINTNQVLPSDQTLSIRLVSTVPIFDTISTEADVLFVDYIPIKYLLYRCYSRKFKSASANYPSLFFGKVYHSDYILYNLQQ